MIQRFRRIIDQNNKSNNNNDNNNNKSKLDTNKHSINEHKNYKY